ncbi:hypothetical protein AMK59_5064, partial [Oryctes borbonicus]
MNRVQNEAYLTAYDATSAATASNYQIIKHLKQEGGWLDLFTPPTFSNDGSQLLLILSQSQGTEAGSYRHIVRFNRVQDSPVIPLTSGKFVVTEILGWKDNMIYYLANTEEDAAVQHVYSLSTNNGSSTCLSCDVKTDLRKEECLYNSAKFSTDY